MFALVGCDGRYVSSYSASMLVRSQWGGRCEMSFSRFSGKYVFKITAGKADGDIAYSASLDEGKISVYYESDGMDSGELLFEISGGESASAHGGYVKAGESVYITVRTEDGAWARGGEFKMSAE